MAHSEILLVKPVEGLGGEGDQVKVRAGYARNYLLPRNIAVPVTTANRKQVDALKKRRAEREAHELTGAQELAKKLEKTMEPISEAHKGSFHVIGYKWETPEHHMEHLFQMGSTLLPELVARWSR